MGKFNPTSSVVPGQVGEIQRAAVEQREAELSQPQQETPAAPAAGGSAVDTLLAGAQASPDMSAFQEGLDAGLEQQQAIEDQRVREQIPHVGERVRDQERVDRWDTQNATVMPNADGGLWARAKNLTDKYNNKEIGLGLRPSQAAFQAGVTVDTVADVEAEVNPGSLVAAIERSGAINRNTIGGSPDVDPKYLQMGTIVTENMLADSAIGDEKGKSEEIKVVSKAQNNQALGTQIHEEYMRWKNGQEGRAPDDYDPIPPEEANTLGAAFKELYYQSVKTPDGHPEQFMTKVTDPATRQSYYKFTRLGEEMLKQGTPYRRRMFPKKHVRPSKTPTPGGQLVGEQGKQTKKFTGKVGQPAGAEVLEAATRNLNKVANVVDTQRMKILFTTALPALQNGDYANMDWMAGINNIGADKMAKFNAAEKADKTGEYNAKENMDALRNTLAQNIRAIAMERNGANYLTYQIQAYNGRIDPQQSYFDPTASKAVRFVTRNAVPAKASPGSRVENNLRQMYALMLVPDADALLPDKRELAVQKWTKQLEAWGDRLKQVLDETMGDNYVEEVAAAIEKGLPMTDPNFPQISPLALDPDADADLIKAIAKKGEDGPHFIDGLIDFANYIKAKRAGRDHYSYFNGYIDGKTNGIASNAILLGNEEMAYQTGVMRNNTKELLDDGDVRDALKQELLTSLENGPDGNMKDSYPEYFDVAQAVFSWRDLNKKTTMTFGYGKELESFGKDIVETAQLLEQMALDGDPEVIKKNNLQTFANSFKQLQETNPDWGETLATQYGQILGNVFNDDAIQARALMRSAAVMAAVTNDIFTIKGPTGFDLNFGGNQALGYDALSDGDITNFSVYEDGKQKSIEAPRYQTHATAAYSGTGVDPITGEDLSTPGQKAYGGSIPGPVQAIDAATVARTASGNSWRRLEAASKGNPYLHTIFDAFKMDAMGYDVVMEEVNKQWLNSIDGWSYLEQAKISHNETMKNFWEKMNARDPDEVVSIAKGGEFQAIGALLSGKKADGTYKQWPSALHGRLFKLLSKDPNKSNEEHGEFVFGMVGRIKKQLENEGFKSWGEDLPSQMTVQQVKTFVAALNHLLDLNSRIGYLDGKTTKQKKDLIKKIRSGKYGKNYQYYAH